MRQDLPEECPFLDSREKGQAAGHRESFGGVKIKDNPIIPDVLIFVKILDITIL